MQSERTADAPALSGSVRGLGVCDALRLELQPVQLRGLVEQIEAVAAALREEIASGSDQPHAAEDELRLVERMLTADPQGPFVVIGPAGPVGTIVGGAMRHAVERLSALVLATTRHDEPARERLIGGADAVSAWARTYVELQAVEDFEPELRSRRR